ncbi:MAG: iron ABC transporter permease [Micrococcales bacterium]|nr:iron ABC transporter permease [Micrococcales bacterium]
MALAATDRAGSGQSRIGRRGRPSGSVRKSSWPLRLAIVLIALAFAAPIIFLGLEAAGLGASLFDIFSGDGWRQPLVNSLGLATAVSLASMTLGAGLAILISRTDVPGGLKWRLPLALPLVIPSFVGATALIAATGPGSLLPFVPRLQGFSGSLVVLTLFTYPYVLLPVLAMISATPTSAEEAARMLGRGGFQTSVRILLPQLIPSVLAGGLLVFLYTLSDFGAVALLRFDTLTRVIYSGRLLDPALSLTLGLLLAILALVVSMLMRAAQPGAHPPVSRANVRYRYRLGRLRSVALVAASLPVVAGLIIPVLIFIGWMFRGTNTIGVGYSGWGDDLGFLVGPLLGSTVASVSAAIAAVVIIVPVAFASVRRSERLNRLAADVVNSVFALPGLVVGLALAAWAVGAPGPLGGLYQTFPLLILGYVLHFGAQALGSGQAALQAVPARFDEAAATLGVRQRQRFWRVDLPLVTPGLLAAAGLVLLSTLKELPLTLMLAPTGFKTLATAIWGAASDGFYAEVGVASLTLIALSGVLTWALVLRAPMRRS